MIDATALILAGGKGTRLSGLYPDMPKALVPIAGEPFLHWLVTWLRREGLRDFVFSLGHRGEQIEHWLDTAKAMTDLHWQACREREPLGTGGGARACLHLCRGDILVMNGDCLLPAPLAPAAKLFEDKSLDGVLFGVPVADTSRFGSLVLDDGNMLTAFREKRPGAGLVNAGMYLLRKSVLETFPRGRNSSMEYDVIPGMIDEGRRLAVHAVASGTPFIDIGTPESLAGADDFIRCYIRKAA